MKICFSLLAISLLLLGLCGLTQPKVVRWASDLGSAFIKSFPSVALSSQLLTRELLRKTTTSGESYSDGGKSCHKKGRKSQNRSGTSCLNFFLLFLSSVLSVFICF